MRLRDDLKPVLVFFAIFVCSQALAEPQIDAIDAIGITVSDVTRSLAFYTEVLTFREVARSEVTGDTYERLTGVSGLRMQVVRLQPGDEFIELIEYLAPRGRPMPTDAHSNDRWFQHIAIVVSDRDKAYTRLRENHVEHASPEPQRLPDWNPDAGGIQAFYFPSFMAAFIDKGRFANLLTEVPVHIILEPRTALQGAASTALTRQSPNPATDLEYL